MTKNCPSKCRWRERFFKPSVELVSEDFLNLHATVDPFLDRKKQLDVKNMRKNHFNFVLCTCYAGFSDGWFLFGFYCNQFCHHAVSAGLEGC